MKMHRYYKMVDGDMLSMRLGRRRARENGWLKSEEAAKQAAIDANLEDQRPMTVDELCEAYDRNALLEFAKKQKVVGRGKMNKRKLAEEIRPVL